MNDKTPQFLSTAAAAQMLGLSTTLIQSLVDRNELQGWKTRGGHRRISLQSIHDYQTNARMTHSAPPRPKAQPRIMIAVETPETLNALQQQSSSWNFSLKLKFIDSITEAMLSLGTDRPDLLVVELAMPRGQQERALMALENFNAKGRPISMVLVTQETHLRSKSQEGNKFIQIAPGPLSAVWLHAYLTGVVATCRS
jgi:excisionase family DNA binding protein